MSDPEGQAHAPTREKIGWVRFAGLLVLVIGAFNIINGLTALTNQKYYVATPDGLLVVTNYDVWGGFWLVLGAVQLLAAFGVLAGKQWARIVAIGLLLLSAVGQVAFLAAFPLYGLLTIGLIIAALHALTVHGEAFGRPSSDRLPGRIIE
jgi:hypothetical protein